MNLPNNNHEIYRTCPKCGEETDLRKSKDCENCGEKLIKNTNLLTMNTNLITVTAQICRCIYHIEMERKSSYAEMLTEVENALEIKNDSFSL